MFGNDRSDIPVEAERFFRTKQRAADKDQRDDRTRASGHTAYDDAAIRAHFQAFACIRESGVCVANCPQGDPGKLCNVTISA